MMKNIFIFSCMIASFLSADSKRLEPFADNPKLELTAEQKAKVEKGELIFWEKSEDWPNAQYFKEGSAVFRVHATPERIWKVLGEFNKYPDWAYKVGGARNYKPSHDDKHYIEFKAQVVGKKYYVEHNFPMAKKGWGTWKTDHEQKSDCVLDTVGFWRVEPVKDHPEQSDVFYSGKVVLNKTCAKGFLGIGGFNGPDMAQQTFKKIKERA